MKKNINVAKAIDDLKKLHGYPPYDDAANPCTGDGYYAASLEKKYGVDDLDELEKFVKFNKYHKLRERQRKEWF